jgi:hypothetical protein
VTSGSNGTTGIAGGFVGSQSFNQWTGSDGKYEIYNGFKRSKWNSYTAYRGRLTGADLNFRYICPLGALSPIFQASGNTWYANCPSLSLSASELNSLLSKLLGKVKGSDFNLAVNLSQTGQLVDMVSSNLGKLGRSILALKRGDFATAARQLGASPKPSKLKPSDVAGRWLELQYGWLPTLSDTYDAAKAFEALSAGPSKTRFSTRTVKKQVLTRVTGNGDSFRVDLDQQYGTSYTFEQYEELSFGRQLGLTDPLSVIWENIPYSFVVDWFVPIGTYLSNLNQIPLLKGRWMVTTSTITKGVRYYWPTGTNFPYCTVHGLNHRYNGVFKYPTGQYFDERVTRAPLGSPPKPPIPDFKLDGAVHGRRFGNALALAYQRFLS